MVSDSIALGVGLELSSFWANLKHRLTRLFIVIYLGNGKAQHLRTLGTFTALRELTLMSAQQPPKDFAEYSNYHDLLGEELALKLPHLVSLRFQAFRQVKLVLSCPKLADARFNGVDSMHVAFEDASLHSLVLKRCLGITIAMSSPKEQLQNLERLEVLSCSEEGSSLIERIGMMKHLKTLLYTDVPTACMPSRFPHNLQRVSISSTDWCSDLPEGLRHLKELEEVYFNSKCESWEVMMPLTELLPINSLKYLALASHVYSAKDLREGKFLLAENYWCKHWD